MIFETLSKTCVSCEIMYTLADRYNHILMSKLSYLTENN